MKKILFLFLVLGCVKGHSTELNGNQVLSSKWNTKPSVEAFVNECAKTYSKESYSFTSSSDTVFLLGSDNPASEVVLLYKGPEVDRDKWDKPIFDSKYVFFVKSGAKIKFQEISETNVNGFRWIKNPFSTVSYLAVDYVPEPDGAVMDKSEADSTSLYLWGEKGLVQVLQYPSGYSHLSEPEAEFTTREVFISKDEFDLVTEYQSKKEVVRYKIDGGGASLSAIENDHEK